MQCLAVTILYDRMLYALAKIYNNWKKIHTHLDQTRTYHFRHVLAL